MGAFGIFMAILTFLYVVYYAITISMDLFGKKGGKKEEVEVFAVGNGSQEDFVEKPTVIGELENQPEKSSDQDTDTTQQPDGGSTTPTPEEAETTASRILAEDANEVYAKVKEAEGKMTKIVAESEDEVTAEEYDTRVAMIMAQGDDNAENMSI